MDLSVPRAGPRVDDNRSGQRIEADGGQPWERSPFLSRRFVVGSLVAFCILVANAVVSYRTTTNLIEASDTLDHTLRFVAALKDVQESVVNAETELRGYIISGERERLIGGLTFLGKARNLVEPLYVLAAVPDQLRKVETLDAMVGQEIDRFGSLIDIHRQQGLAAAIRAIRDTAGQATMRRIQVLAAELAADGDGRLRRRSEQSVRSSGMSVVNTVIAILLNVGLLGAVILLARREIRERRQAEEVVKFAATHDPLTGLPNRLLLADRATRALAAAASEKRSVAMLFVDLDRFKNINDSLGHETGDRLLQTVASRLARCVRRSDTVARQGGDEFVVLIESFQDPADLAFVAEKILASVAEPMTLYGREFEITASIGISTCPPDGYDLRTLLKSADSAMFRAKEQGNTYRFYAKQMSPHSFERLELESALRHAMERNELTLHYQPKIQARTGRVTGIECLLRWQHPTVGHIPVDQVVLLAEETGLIVPIGKWILRTACVQAQKWAQQGLPRLRLAINLSARQFASATLLDDVMSILDETGTDPRRIEFEVTESVMIRDLEQGVKLLRSLKATGVRLTIDDFGTGYSSLSYLKHLPVDCVKIDASFIRGIPMDASDVAITETILAMSSSLGLKVVAEGVETSDQIRFLESEGCDEMQGFYFSKPLPADELAEYIRERRIVGEDTTAGLKLVAAGERRARAQEGVSAASSR